MLPFAAAVRSGSPSPRHSPRSRCLAGCIEPPSAALNHQSVLFRPLRRKPSRPGVAPSYQIDTALYRLQGSGRQRLQSGARVEPGRQPLRRSACHRPRLRVHRQRRRPGRVVSPLSLAGTDHHQPVAGTNRHSHSRRSEWSGSVLAGDDRRRTRALPHLRQSRAAHDVRADVRGAAPSGSRQTCL